MKATNKDESYKQSDKYATLASIEKHHLQMILPDTQNIKIMTENPNMACRLNSYPDHWGFRKTTILGCRYEHVIGKHEPRRMNKNGELFTDFWAISNMVIGGSIFPHKDIPKTTWQFPDHVTENKTDHMCLGQKFRRTLQGVRVQGDANALLDFHLVMAMLKLHLKQCPVQKNPRA